MAEDNPAWTVVSALAVICVEGSWPRGRDVALAFTVVPGLSLVVASRGHCPVAVRGLLIVEVSRCRAQAPGAWASGVAACRLHTCSTWSLVAVAHRLSCPLARGIF